MKLVFVVVTFGIALLAIGALAITWTIPFQEWNAYSSGTWSMLIYQGAGLLPPEIDPVLKQSPLVYVGQGLIWKAIGWPSMRAARTYSLVFSVLLVLATYWLARPAPGRRLTATLAAFLAAGSPLLTEGVSSTLCDIPAAAMLWLGFLSLRRARSRPGEWIWWLLGGTSFALALLSRTTVLPFVALFLVHAALRTPWRGLRDRLVAAAAVAAPLAVTALYFVSTRGDPKFGWGYFLFNLTVRYYTNMAAGSRADNLAQLRWFGVFVSALFVTAVAARVARLLQAARPRWSGWSAVIPAAAAAYVVLATRFVTDAPLRPHSFGFSDRWMAGTIAVIALLALLVYSIRDPSTSWDRESLRMPALVMLYGALWWWKLGYDTTFLILILPPVAVFIAGWLTSVIERASVENSWPVTACILIVFVAVGWEGARRMDRGFPAFSNSMVEMNVRNGLSPEKKLIDIFGESASVMQDLQDMVRRDPRISMVSPDNRLKFFLGRNVTLTYPREPHDLGPYQILIWVNNVDIRSRYRDTYRMSDPIGRLNSTGLLTPITRTLEYEVYRIGAPAASTSSGPGSPKERP